MKKIRVLVIDDSALMRKLLVEFLSEDPQIEVVGTAPDPIIARDKIKVLNPDVLTLDIEMPRMDGLTFLENLMRLRPMPVVMVSSLTERGAEVTLQALELGAVDFVTKPKIDLEAGLREYAHDLILKVKAAASARIRVLSPNTRPAPSGSAHAAAPAPLPALRRGLFRTTERIIAVGASTGGTEAIKDVLAMMPADAPAILITQHIPAAFSGPFAARMDRSSAMSVCEARDGQQIVPGHVYIAPGDWHLSLARDGARYVCRLDQAPPQNRHRPSVDVLFRSVAHHAGANAVGAVLTGMGDDGARGLLAMREAGARTLVQDEASSVVWGMPGAAFKLGAAEQICELSHIAESLLAFCGAQAA
ncbi:MAG: chemotaxis response regulator protein-glutamate methylesterase [Hydrocarboniphaga sp.]|uniref:protein-glutamate methylesterase/protein-glutamine glutaminase n=1 Tax=Hydrocarboniphaga sp. TaxID=2033016 RepID=UPI00261C9B17|nr:chemotaxis response regulator protein-glutamate methylesterase [Hydrocarboniphaga sp.]MDB5972784.1 chemotaxis response regulator protein-glutamate methylesterase [Hydrocarboniphaga sp.]